MTKHAVGVFNGNFRGGDYYRYAREVSDAGREKFKKDFSNAEADLQEMLGDSFCEWWDAYPSTMSKGEFLPIMQAKIVELQTEPISPEVAHAMDYDTDAEEREIAEFCTDAKPQETILEELVKSPICPHVHYNSAMFQKLECFDCHEIFEPRTIPEQRAAFFYNGRGSAHFTQIQGNSVIRR